jgi:glucose/arabinose dehydrogenase
MAHPLRFRPRLIPLERRDTPTTLPPGFVETTITTNLVMPTAMDIAPDGRVFVAEQTGNLRIIENGSLLTTPFLTVAVNSSGERGLLGVTFDPNFATNGYVYIFYTMPDLRSRISRFTANRNVAVAGSEVVLLEFANASGASNHNGGALHIGPDNKLYAAVGDNAVRANSQLLTNLYGKILRLNLDGSIPTDNPFYNSVTGDNRAIWALGLRNPFTFAFQSGTGRMFINDVGAATWEEINDGIAGANYGWPNTEGPTSDPAFQSPIFAYRHDSGTPIGFAITGGAFYNPQTPTFPADFDGDYFFADYVGNWIYRRDDATGDVTAFATGLTAQYPVDIDVTTGGSLLYLSRTSQPASGTVTRIDYVGGQAPAISQQPANQFVSAGHDATFSVVANGTAPLRYQWQRDGSNIAGETSADLTLSNVQLSDNGAQFRVIVTNDFGVVTSTTATLSVTANQPPVATITLPAEGTTYRAGDTISFAGTATDPETGDLPAIAYTWRVDFHHDAHTHPFVTEQSGITNGTFAIPTIGETSPNVWYRIHLTATDPVGLTHSVYRDVVPITSQVTVASNVPGAVVFLDGVAVNSPATFTGVAGMSRLLAASPTLFINGQSWIFQNWSDGGAISHSIATPATATTYTATYRRGEIFAVGSGGGGEPAVVVYDAVSGVERTRFLAYAAGFRGGVRVATGDVTGDGVEDIVTAAGPGGGPHVRVFDGVTFQEIGGFFAFSTGFTGGVNVALGDVDGDGRAEIITGAGAGGGPHVRVFNALTGSEIRGFFAYNVGFRGGVTVAAGDVSGDGRADIITGTGAGGGPHVRVFNGMTLAEFRGFFAYGTGFLGGVNVAAGDLNGDGRADIITGPGAGGGPQVRAFDAITNNVISDFMAYPIGFRGGVRVSTADVNADGRADIITGAGGGGGPHVRSFAVPLSAEDSFFAFSTSFLGGVFVG